MVYTQHRMVLLSPPAQRHSPHEALPMCPSIWVSALAQIIFSFISLFPFRTQSKLFRSLRNQFHPTGLWYAIRQFVISFSNGPRSHAERIEGSKKWDKT